MINVMPSTGRWGAPLLSVIHHQRAGSCTHTTRLYTPHPPAADIISAVEFDHTGDHLATGDRGGRVVLFEHVIPEQVW